MEPFERPVSASAIIATLEMASSMDSNEEGAGWDAMRRTFGARYGTRSEVKVKAGAGSPDE